jgi:hypothetical protein
MDPDVPGGPEDREDRAVRDACLGLAQSISPAQQRVNEDSGLKSSLCAYQELGCGYRKPGTACGALNIGPATVTVCGTMAALLVAFCAALRAGARSRVELKLELLALRH